SGGQAPRAATLDAFASEERIPARGIRSVAIPGMVDAWSVIHQRWGSLPLASLLEPSIGYAAEGFPVSRRVATALSQFASLLAESATSRRVFFKDDHPLSERETLVQADLARTLQAIAEGGSDAFYRGETAKRIARFCQEESGFLREEDFAQYRAQVLEPITTSYRGYTVYEQPLNSQGIILLEALNIVEGLDLPRLATEDPARAIHIMAEAIRASFADCDRYAGDPDFVEVPLAMIISKEQAAKRREEILSGVPGQRAEILSKGDTTSFVIADSSGNLVSFIQSNFSPFGSGVVAGDTGVLLNNRLSRFSLKPDHPNRLEPGKRTVHTLNTYLVFRDGRPLLAGGTPGADFQVQTNLQVLTNILDFGLDVQRAVETPRWGYTQEQGLQLESGFSPTVEEGLRGLRDKVSTLEPGAFLPGIAQVLMRDATSGYYTGGSDPRGEGCALGF
ncbi:MAG TPA: gamma-glutamyltransferase family protein, partial [Dehalococcoidia bacterium]|nr:gamma-glutamyltransferase family protein [Dehalococcoidia bacterium]